MSENKSFFQTLPGIFAGIASVIVASTGMYVVFHNNDGEKNKLVRVDQYITEEVSKKVETPTRKEPLRVNGAGNTEALVDMNIGGKDQLVLDNGPNEHSVFTGHLLEAQGEGMADKNKDEYKNPEQVEEIDYDDIEGLSNNLMKKEKKLAEIKTKLKRWQKSLDLAYDVAVEVDKNKDLEASSKVLAWKRFVNNFSQDNPYSMEDQLMRNKAMERLNYWQTYKESKPVKEKPSVTNTKNLKNGQNIIDGHYTYAKKRKWVDTSKKEKIWIEERIESNIRIEGHYEDRHVPSGYWQEYEEKTWIPSHYEGPKTQQTTKREEAEEAEKAELLRKLELEWQSSGGEGLNRIEGHYMYVKKRKWVDTSKKEKSWIEEHIEDDQRIEGHYEDIHTPSGYWQEYEEKTWIPEHYE